MALLVAGNFRYEFVVRVRSAYEEPCVRSREESELVKDNSRVAPLVPEEPYPGVVENYQKHQQLAVEPKNSTGTVQKVGGYQQEHRCSGVKQKDPEAKMANLLEVEQLKNWS